MNVFKKHSELLSSIYIFTGALISSILFIWGGGFPYVVRKIFTYLCVLILLLILFSFTQDTKGEKSQMIGSQDFKFMISKYRHRILDYFFFSVYGISALISVTYDIIRNGHYYLSGPLKYLLIFAWGVYVANKLIMQADRYLQKVAERNHSEGSD